MSKIWCEYRVVMVEDRFSVTSAEKCAKRGWRPHRLLEEGGGRWAGEKVGRPRVGRAVWEKSVLLGYGLRTRSVDRVLYCKRDFYVPTSYSVIRVVNNRPLRL